MPKQTLKITDFSGGLNTENNARDIEDNEWCYLANFTGSDTGVLRLTGQFTYVSDVCAGIGLSEDAAYTSDGQRTNDIMNIPPGPEVQMSGARGLFSWSSDYNLLKENDSYLVPTEILHFGSRKTGYSAWWQYYGAGEQQSLSTSKIDAVGGIVNGFGPYNAVFKAWSNVYPWGASLQPDGDKFTPLKTQPTAALGGYGENNIWHALYSVGGALRYTNGNHRYVGGVQPKWFGYIPKKKYGVQSGTNIESSKVCSVDVGGGWIIQDACVERGIYRNNLRMINSSTYKIDGSVSGADLWSFGKALGDHIVPNVRNDFWGLSLDFREETGDTDDTGAEGSGSWQETVNTRYKFYATVLYDDAKQESHPTTFKMYPTASNYDEEWPDSNGNYGQENTQLGGGTPEMYFCGVGTDEGMALNNGAGLPTKDNIVLNQSIYFKPTLCLQAYPSEGFDWSPNAGLQLDSFSIPSTFTSDITDEDKYGFMGATRMNSSSVVTPKQGNQRATGMRIYWSSNEDGHADLWIMFELDFVKGVKAYGMGSGGDNAGEWAPWEQFYDPNSDGGALNGLAFTNMKPSWSKDVQFRDPPRVDTYFSLNQRNYDVATAACWRTSAFLKGRMYIANYKRPLKTFFETASVWHQSGVDVNGVSNYNVGWINGNIYDYEIGGDFHWPRTDGTGPYYSSYTDANNYTWEYVADKQKIHSDKVCKSPIGQYDIFPADGEHELVFGETEDGDEIIHLASTSDKLLIFKIKSLIIVVPEDDSVEATHPGLGLDGQYGLCQVCKTDFGVAWVNSTGCYHYDGSEVKSLSGAKISNFVKNGEFNALPFNSKFINDPDDNFHLVKSLRWTVPDSLTPPNYDEAVDTVSGGESQPYGDVNQSIGFDPTSKKLIWRKNVGYTQNDGNPYAIHSGPNNPGGGYWGNPMNLADTLIYDFKTDSWTLARHTHEGTQGMSNFVNFKGKLLSYAYGFSQDKLAYAAFYGDPTDLTGYGGGAQATDSEAYRVWQWTDDPLLVADRGPAFCHKTYAPKAGYAPSFNNAMAVSKDFDFGDAGTRKKIYKVYMTYRCKFGIPNVMVRYRTNGHNVSFADSYIMTSKMTIDGTETSNSSGSLHGPTGDYKWTQVELKPKTSSEANNIYSFQLFISQEGIRAGFQGASDGSLLGGGAETGWNTTDVVTGKGTGFIDSSFEINDITIVYKMKSIK